MIGDPYPPQGSVCYFILRSLERSTTVYDADRPNASLTVRMQACALRCLAALAMMFCGAFIDITFWTIKTILIFPMLNQGIDNHFNNLVNLILILVPVVEIRKEFAIAERLSEVFIEMNKSPSSSLLQEAIDLIHNPRMQYPRRTGFYSFFEGALKSPFPDQLVDCLLKKLPQATSRERYEEIFASIRIEQIPPQGIPALLRLVDRAQQDLPGKYATSYKLLSQAAEMGCASIVSALLTSVSQNPALTEDTKHEIHNTALYSCLFGCHWNQAIFPNVDLSRWNDTIRLLKEVGASVGGLTPDRLYTYIEDSLFRTSSSYQVIKEARRLNNSFEIESVRVPFLLTLLREGSAISIENTRIALIGMSFCCKFAIQKLVIEAPVQFAVALQQVRLSLQAMIAEYYNQEDFTKLPLEIRLFSKDFFENLNKNPITKRKLLPFLTDYAKLCTEWLKHLPQINKEILVLRTTLLSYLVLQDAQPNGAAASAAPRSTKQDSQLLLPGALVDIVEAYLYRPLPEKIQPSRAAVPPVAVVAAST